MTLTEFRTRLIEATIGASAHDVMNAAVTLFAEGPEARRLQHLAFVRRRRGLLAKWRKCVACGDKLEGAEQFKRCAACREKHQVLKKNRRAAARKAKKCTSQSKT